jgi:hypothetical protein
MNADRRIIGVNTLIALPLCPLAVFRAVAHEEATDRGVWRTGCRIKVGGDLDPDITWTRNIWIWWFGRVELEPTKLELLGILGRESGAVWTAFGKRCQHGSALCGGIAVDAVSFCHVMKIREVRRRVIDGRVHFVPL